MKRTPAVWVDPISVDTGLLVNREAELDDLVARLEELRVERKRSSHIMVSGARGVGKSIFTRSAIERFERQHPNEVVSIVADARGLYYRPFLSELAKKLIDSVRRKGGEKRPEIALWLAHLEVLATSSVVREAEMAARTRKYGADTTIGADTILAKLSARFVWEESRTFQRQGERTLTVTDELLHASINATLERLAEKDSPWSVVLFLDDLDQLAEVEDVPTVFRRLLDVKPCISIVHFRTESLMEDVKREVPEQVSLPSLTPETLFEVVMRRLHAASEQVRGVFPTNSSDPTWAPLRWLAMRTGNPLTLLRWFHGLLRAHGFPPEGAWQSPEGLLAIVKVADPMAGASPDFVDEVVRYVESVDGGDRGRGVTEDELVGAGLTTERIADAARFGMLLPKYRFNPAAGFRLMPLLDLLRTKNAKA